MLAAILLEAKKSCGPAPQRADRNELTPFAALRIFAVVKQFLICAALLFSLWPGRAAIPSDGLVLYYPFPGDSFDRSPSANDGRVVGATLTKDRFGNDRSAYRLSGLGNYIEAAGPLPEMESCTVSLWLSLESWFAVQNWAGPQAVFFEGDDNGGRDLALILSGGLHFIVKSDERLTYANWLPEVGAWTHVVCVADADSGLAMWVNGNKVAVGPFAGGANRGFHAPFNLRRRPGGFNDWHLAGSIDQVRVYDRALSDLEIGQIYWTESGAARSVKISIETVRLSMAVEPGKKYILQSSGDLVTWTDFGVAFTAATAQQDATVQVDDQKTFWRVVVAPN
jgi:hypothetical protein